MSEGPSHVTDPITNDDEGPSDDKVIAKKELQALMPAAFKEGRVEAMWALLEGGAVDFNLVFNGNGHNFLHHAASDNNVKVVKALAEVGVDLNKATEKGEGCTALFLAALVDHVHGARALLEAGADID